MKYIRSMQSIELAFKLHSSRIWNQFKIKFVYQSFGTTIWKWRTKKITNVVLLVCFYSNHFYLKLFWLKIHLMNLFWEVSLMMLGQGCTIGFVAYILEKNVFFLFGPLTNDLSSWHECINCVGSFIGCTIFGCFVSFVSFIRALLILITSSFMLWLLAYFGNNYYSILAERFCGGWFIAGLATITILTVSETTNPK